MHDEPTAKAPMLAAPLDPHDMNLGDEQRIDAEIDGAPPPVASTRSRRAQVFLGVSLVLLAFNLRPIFSSLGALLPEVIRSLHLSPSAASAITTLPVLCLGLFAPVAPLCARNFGAERTVLGFMTVLVFGTAARGLGGTSELIAGTLLSGAAIAIVNVLLPGLIKRDFPQRTGLMTGLYTMALCAGAAMAAGVSIPMERLLGSWGLALEAWAIPVIVAIVWWLPQVPTKTLASNRGRSIVRGLWRCPLAWQVTIFMVLQSMLSFTVFGWLAPILRDRGMHADLAGLTVSVSVMMQTIACLFAPMLASRLPDQRWLNVVVVVLAVGGFMGCLFAPLSSIWYWSVLQGIGQGALTSVALTLIVLRSENAHVAAQLSSMVQGVGYGVGALGPLLVGLLHGWTGGFGGVGALFILVGTLAVFVGMRAGRAMYVKGVVHEVRVNDRLMTELAR
ncbi:MAG: transporter, family, cyanate transporter [Caballeronia sp.]|jgi:CP family cyanate transporter-like MFS transporter|nr:transporter, family, cyanate transporter [Caballeronia sp.]